MGPQVSEVRAGGATQRGFGLIGAVVAVAVLSLLMAGIAMRALHDMRVRQGELIGREMARLNAAVVDFTRRYHDEIKARALDDAASAYAGEDRDETAARALLRRADHALLADDARTRRLTITDKKDVGRLLDAIAATGVGIRPPMPQGRYVVRFDVTGPKCARENTGACAIDSALYIDQPVQREGNRVDYLKLGAALRQLGPGAGASLSRSPQFITFSASSRTGVPPGKWYPNPVRLHPAGILLIDNLRRVDHLPFLRTSGGRMDGDIDLQQHDVNDVGVARVQRLAARETLVVGDHNILPPRPRGSIAASGDIRTSKSLLAEDRVEGHTLQGKQLIADTGITSYGSIAARGDIAAEGAIQSTADITTGSTLILGTVATEGHRCPPNGALSMDASRKLLHCRHGSWEAVHKEPDVAHIAREVRIIHQREDGRMERQKMVVNVGPRYFLQNNYSDNAIEGEWDHCAIEYVVNVNHATLRSRPGTSRREWWINGQAAHTEVGDSWGQAHVRCERRWPE